MSKRTLTIVGSLLAILIVGLIYLYRVYGKAVAPVILPPSRDIRAILNTTDMPLKLPEGVAISIYASELGKPRDILEMPDGVLLVSIPSEGRVVALVPETSGSEARVMTVISGLVQPHGLEKRCDANDVCEVFIAETERLAVYDWGRTGAALAKKRDIVTLPPGGRHFSRTLAWHDASKGELLVSIGSTCDVCREKDARHGSVQLVNIETGNMRLFSSGLRNAVFMARHPETGKVWVTEMGRDNLGDDLPPDEIDILKDGGNFGWPMCYGKNIHDSTFDTNTYIRNPCQEPLETESFVDLPAHSAPLGLGFFPKSWESVQTEYADDLLVAFHGSWNRSQPTGYKLARLKFSESGVYEGMEDFISGWLQNGGALGRPVDVLFAKNGQLYVSDDKSGLVYQITLVRSPTSY